MRQNFETEPADSFDYKDLRYSIRYRLDKMHNRRKAAIRKAIMKAGVSFLPTTGC